jgi:hypothetical protein
VSDPEDAWAYEAGEPDQSWSLSNSCPLDWECIICREGQLTYYSYSSCYGMLVCVVLWVVSIYAPIC